MKYMGSKRAMLRNGLGELLQETISTRTRFYDLFCGSGSVAGFVAQGFDIPVVACDLQSYASTMAAAHIEQTECFDFDKVWADWSHDACNWLERFPSLWQQALTIRPRSGINDDWRACVTEIRALCATLPIESFPLARAYGGYYFSFVQSLVLDALRANLPTQYRVASLAALLDAASTCAAAPGHTAQPFSTKDSALPHLATAWSRDIASRCADALAKNAKITARKKGRAYCCNASELVPSLNDGDLVFIDPPYSEVQYSRFYHVLESISRGTVTEVSGTGRYPPISERPQSRFCLVTESNRAFDELMKAVAATGAEAIVTFPAQAASNGMSGDVVEAISDQYFTVKKKKISSVFSTLGGNAISRTARMTATELVLHLAPQ